MYDAIVVGARCAGAATAMLMARQGLAVLLVDRARFGSDIPHGHFVHKHGPARLARWGLLDAVLATGCEPVTAITNDLGDGLLTGRDLEVDGVPMGLGPRRSELDRVLVEAAVAAGADVRFSTPVDGFLSDGERICGIRARTGGRALEERARIVIGADGRNSSLARLVDAPVSQPAPTLTCWYWSYYAHLPVEGLEMYVCEDRVIFVFPTNDGLTAVFVGVKTERLAEAKADPDAFLHASARMVGGLGERLETASREERILGATQLPNFVRRPFGEGWALVGDAGCHKDPFMALGICDALRDAELLAGAVVRSAAEPDSEAAHLEAFERERNEATLGEYGINMHMARFAAVPPERLALRAAVRGDAALTREFFLAAQGMVDPRPFFAADNVQRLLARSAPATAG